MSLETQIKQLVATTTRQLVAGKYQLVTVKEHTSTLEYKGSTLEIWTANGASYCKVYGKVQGLEFPEFTDKDVKAIVFKIATTITPYTLRKQLSAANKDKIEKYYAYTKSVQVVKDIKVNLKALK
jgi:hypothetical protein